MAATRILLIDDHALFREGLRMVLEARMQDMEVFEAASLCEAMTAVPEAPDVTLLDLQLPGLNGMEGIALLKRKWPTVPVIVLSSQDEPETERLALSRGASGFVSKADNADNIIASIDMALRGEFAALANRDEHGSTVGGTQVHLTPRQCEVLDLLCRGLSNKLIARELLLSENTVRGHVQGILEFLQVASRSEAIFAARQRRLVG